MKNELDRILLERREKLEVDKCCLLTLDSNKKVRLGSRLLSDGRESLFLEYYFGYTMVYDENSDKMKPKKQKRREKLNMYLWHNPKTSKEKTDNDNTLELAKKKREEAEKSMEDDVLKEELKQKREPVNFISFMDDYVSAYAKKDERMIKIACQRFKDFLKDTQEYNKFKDMIRPEHITSDMILDFVDYLKSRSRGEGAASLYQRFKKVYKAAAIKCNISYQKPFVTREGKSITIPVDEDSIVKEILSPEEISKMIATHYDGENTEIRDAFIFCIYTAMRFCDVKELTFGAFDFANKKLTYEQNKTKGHSKHSNANVPIHEGITELLKDKMGDAEKDKLVFSLPSHTMCLKALRTWTKRAGIDKHITWHCARHTAGTIMARENPIRVVQEIMGHSNISYTEKYTRVVDEQKEAAVGSVYKSIITANNSQI